MTLLDLWLPILLSAVFVFVASSILHMVIPMHRKDVVKLPGEDAIAEAIRNQNVPPGDYMFPCAGSMKEMSSPEMIEKFTRGPVGFMTVFPSGPPGIGKNLAQWFLYTVLVGAAVAYVGTVALAPGAEYGMVFRLTGTVAILVYALGSVPNSIWKGTKWTTTAKFLFDGVVYGLLTGGTMGWLWPDA